MLDIARHWVEELGVSVIPIRAKSKKPALRWRPYIDRLPRPDELYAWWPNTNGNNYGIAALPGWSDLVIADFDSSWRHSVWLARLPPPLAKLALLTYRVKTRRGIHYYFYSNEKAQCTTMIWDKCETCATVTQHRRIPDPSKKLVRCLDCGSEHEQVGPQGVDIKARGGYCLAPPTVHPSGHTYAGIGTPANIQRVNSIYELLPEARRQENLKELYHEEDAETDLWDLAMRSSAGVSIEEIKKHFSIARLLSRPSNGNGRRWTTLCPLHAEKTPSFVVFPDGHAHCFGCGWRGDVCDLFAALNRISLRDAIREMASQI